MKKGFFINLILIFTILTGCTYSDSNINDIDNVKPIFNGLHNFSVTVNTTEIDYLEGISAIDNDDIDLTSNIVVDDSLVDLDNVGAYLLSYQVTDDNGNETIAYVIINVIKEAIISDLNKPVINGIKSFNIKVNSGQPNYLTGISAVDNIDGDITNNITVDTSQIDLSKVGVYIISYSVTDSDDNTEKAYSFVYVYDDNINTTTSIVERKKDAVVGVSNISNNEIIGTGSGVIYKKENNNYYIITNYHVIEGSEELEVVFADYSFTSATVIGYDADTDLAVLLINTNKQLPIISFASHNDTNVANEVIAIGNPLGFGLFGSVSTGVVSGVDRYIPVDIDGDDVDDVTMTLLQHDAAINPGNSGGALLNNKGELIGINNLKIIGEDIDNISFSIPIRTIERVVGDLETYYNVQRPVLGVEVIDLYEAIDNGYTIANNVEYGAYVSTVFYKSPAYYCGLVKGDIIIAIDDITVYSSEQLKYELFLKHPYDTVKITYYNRSGIIHETSVTLD